MMGMRTSPIHEERKVAKKPRVIRQNLFMAGGLGEDFFRGLTKEGGSGFGVPFFKEHPSEGDGEEEMSHCHQGTLPNCVL